MGVGNAVAFTDFVLKGGRVLLSRGGIYRNDHALAVRVWAARNKPLKFSAGVTPGFRAALTVGQILRSIGILTLPENVSQISTIDRSKLLVRLLMEDSAGLGPYLSYALGLDENDAYFLSGVNSHEFQKMASAQRKTFVTYFKEARCAQGFS